MSAEEFEQNLKNIRGNAPIECKRHLLSFVKPPPFGKDIASRAVLSKIDLKESIDENGKRRETCTAVWKLIVEEGTNSGNLGLD